MIDICLSIDLEFDIAGTFADPNRWAPIGEPRVICPTREGESGLPFLLSTLEEHGLHATFFVETAQVCFFGDSPMGRQVERILKAGHDVQLHLHPCWFNFSDPNWQTRLNGRDPPDNCDGRSVANLIDMIGAGLNTLERWGVQRAVAFRSGGLRADRNLYRALAQCNLFLSSSIGLAVWSPREQELKLRGGRHWVESVLEIPVLSYNELSLGPWERKRLFTVSATSEGEARALLNQASEAAVGPIVYLMHPFEFISGDLRFPWTVRPNSMTKRRLVNLCKFIVANPMKFRAVTFGEMASAWLKQGHASEPHLTAPFLAALHRMSS